MDILVYAVIVMTAGSASGQVVEAINAAKKGQFDEARWRIALAIGPAMAVIYIIVGM